MEIWKPIIGYEGLYEVSNFGRIKSLPRVWICGNKKSKRSKPETISRIHHNKQKYLQVWLSKEGIAKIYRVHRLVAQAFIPNTENKETVNHINGIKDDNRIENLEWNTLRENQDHATINNLRVFVNGENHGASVLTEKNVLEIRAMSNFYTKMDIARKFNVSHKTIRSILARTTWKHI